ncbi:DNA polymerase III PolC-type-like [Mercenaria mercenaria]|uniref:DNA polymerase III PolC-type-like n=1 Tax=Mercenaria mercenaria TaxID=6596 RepID=UPI00234EA81A|nr:DNA polymerase III PolC-type-like [Mercenaria mercenaria]
MDTQRKANAQRQMSTAYKKRRFELKEQRLFVDTVHEVHEGKMYESGIEATNSVSESDIEQIPAPSTVLAEQTCEIENKNSIIVFDLETTGLGADSSIIQIAAQHFTSGDAFSCYVKPQSGFIPARASKVTGIELHGGVLFHNNLPVTAVKLSRALEMFKNWVEKYKQNVLVAHNVHFDSKVLMNSYKKQKIDSPDIAGFADSLSLLRKLYPNADRHTQEFLVKHVLGKTYDAHNAVSDVSTLVELLYTVENVERKSTVLRKQEVLHKIEKK